MGDISSIGLEILTLAQKGHSRFEFKKNTSTHICNYFECMGLDFYIREFENDYTWLARISDEGGYSFQKADMESEETRKYRSLSNIPDRLNPNPIVDEEGVRLTISISIDKFRSGWISYIWKPETSVQPEVVSECHAIAEIFAKAVFFRNSQSALNERIKELTCLYDITRIMHKSQRRLKKTLHEVAKKIPAAFQYEDSARSRIVLDEREYHSGIEESGQHSLKSIIKIAGFERGFIEVSYASADSDSEEKKFLLEEQNLLNGIAKQLSLLIEEHEAAVEKQKLEEQFRHADRLTTIGQLAAGVAHEINEPLASILGFAELIKKDSGLTGQAARDLDRIIKASMFARDTVRKLLVFSGKIQPGETEVDINEIITEAIQFLDMRFKRSNIEIVMELDDDLQSIAADPGQINQVLINLFMNSIQALPDGGVIQIHSGVKADMIYLSVEDNGTGIPEDIQSSIFMPFFTTKAQGEGTGLGLVVAHGIVRAYGGNITVQSKVGKFTRFTISLPLKESYEH